MGAERRTVDRALSSVHEPARSFHRLLALALTLVVLVTGAAAQSLLTLGDFNRDGKADILWRNTSTGQPAIWLMNGLTPTSQGVLSAVDPAWAIVGIGDFDGDGKADLLWRNTSTGQLAIWLMNGLTPTSEGVVSTVDPVWAIVGIGDFNGDGKADLLWRNTSTGQLAIWLMNGLTPSSEGVVSTVDPVWAIVGVGDFNGDGKADLLWRNTSTGQLAIWLMNGLTPSSEGVVSTVDPVWAIVGVGDFNGDGKADLLWRNTSTGQLAIWLMNGLTPINEGVVAAVDPAWAIVGIGDFNGDGKADLLWRNTSTGQLAMWLMNGLTPINEGVVAAVDSAWQVIAVSPSPSTSFPSSNHVFVVMEENQSFSQVFPSGSATNCSSAGMPYLCSLAAANGMALNFYANQHGSLLEYLYNTSGADWTGSPYDCNGAGCASLGVITGDNIVPALQVAGKTWRGYFEDMPFQGYMGADTANYVQRHNPFVWYADVANSTAEQNNMYPFTQFAQDVNAGTFQNFSYIVPNLLDDAGGTGSQTASALLLAADNWLETNISPLLSTPAFQPGGDGILIVVFDEGDVAGESGDSTADNSCSPTQSSGCGGHIAFVMIGPNVIPASTTSNTYHFQDMLHTIIHLLGMTDYMNNASQGSDIALLPGVQ